MTVMIDCPNCKMPNVVQRGVPLREQFCELCRWALRLDCPEKYDLIINFEPYEVPE
jgi:hypothetical protein